MHSLSIKSLKGAAPSHIKLANLHASKVSDVEFSEKRWVWIPDPHDGYLKGWVESEEDAFLNIRCDDDKDHRVHSDKTEKVNPPKFDRIDDMASLTYLNEPSVAHNLRQRFEASSVYTNSGMFLVAVNPYKTLPIYGSDMIQEVRLKRQDDISIPHIFSIADKAYRQLLESRQNQSILITGESGAGKTENTKKVIQYLTAAATTLVRSGSSASLENGILRANPVLEAFGNAKTVRNDNSSRFGKFIRIHFDETGSITGAHINWFLLEKSRVASQGLDECNYHIFYQLLQGLPSDLKKDLLLEDLDKHYDYLQIDNKGRSSICDVQRFNELIESFEVMGISREHRLEHFRIMAAILHMGNLKISVSRSDQARLDDPVEAEKLCFLLGIDVKQFTTGLLTPRMKAGREIVANARNVAQVRASLAGLAKALYERNFGSLVDRINASIAGKSDVNSIYIGVLDMAGFEIFQKNSFEQLCINHTNEKLQQFFNHHMFVLEQEEYAREQIEWKFVDFGLDLQPTIELIEKVNPIGVLSCLDEECVMPRATDVSFTEKVHQLWSGKTSKYRPAKFAQDGFVITHYAAQVEYTTQGWLEKNKDPVNDNLTDLLCKSTFSHIAALFNNANSLDVTHLKKGAFRTVAQRHKEQLGSLMRQLESTHPHFVRCIIPNHIKSSTKFDMSLVLDQLRCNGVLEGIRIARSGFPNRLYFADFKHRYSVLAKDLPRGFVEARKSVERILEAIELDKSCYRLGLSKVFFRAGVLAELEEQRDCVLRAMIIAIQSTSRAFLIRRSTKKRLFRNQATALLKNDFRNFNELGHSAWWQLFMKMKPILSATRSDREVKLRSAEISKLEALNQQKATLVEKAQADLKRVEAARSTLAEALEVERQTAVDKDALFERSRVREAELRDSLDISSKQISALEARCAELVNEKQQLKVDIAQLESVLESSTEITHRLRSDKDSVVKQLQRAQTLLDENTAQHDDMQTITKRYEGELRNLQDQLRGNVEQQNQAEKLRTEQQKVIDQLRSTEASRAEYSKRQVNAAQLERNAAQAQLTKLIESTSDTETFLRKKGDELETCKATIAKLQHELSVSRAAGTTSEGKAARLQTELTDVSARLSATEEALKLAQADSSKSAEGSSTNSVDLNAQALEFDRVEELHKHRLEIERRTRESETYKMAVQKLEVINGGLVKQIAKTMQDVLQAREALKSAKSGKIEANNMENELQQRLTHTQGLLNASEKASLELQHQLRTAQEQVRSTTAQMSQVDVEKERFRREALDMRARYDELQLQRRSTDSNNQNVSLELVQTKERLSKLLSEHDAVTTDLSKAQSRLAYVDKLDKNLVATQVRDLEKSQKAVVADLEASRAHAHDLEDKLTGLLAKRARHEQDLEDLKHELDQKNQAAQAAHGSIDKLKAQLIELRTQIDMEKQAKEASQVLHKKLQHSLDATAQELKDRTNQVIALHQAVSEEADVMPDWAQIKTAVTTKVDLAKELHLARSACKRAENSKLNLERQLQDIKKNQRDLQEFDAKRPLHKARSDSISTLDISAMPPSPSRPTSAPWTPPHTLRGSLQDPGRSRTNSLAQNFENQKLARLEPVKADNLMSRKLQVLQDEVDSLTRQLQLSGKLTESGRASQTATIPESSQTIARLQQENDRLRGSLETKSNKMYAMEAAQRQDREFLRDLQHKSMAEIETTFQKLADERIEIVRTHKRSLAELQAVQAEADGLRTTKLNLQTNLRELQASLEEQIAINVGQTQTFADLQDHFDDAQSNAEREGLRAQELADSLNLYKTRAEEYFDRLEQAEANVSKASHAEQWMKKRWQESEETLASTLKDRSLQDTALIDLSNQAQSLARQLEDRMIELDQMRITKARVEHELSQHRETLGAHEEEAESAAVSTRKAYQREISTLTQELENERSHGLRLRDEHASIRLQLEDLHSKWSQENLNAATWEKEAGRQEQRIADMARTIAQNETSYRETQAKYVDMLSELRELRIAKEDIEADRDSLLQAKRTVETKYKALQEQTSSVDAPKLQTLSSSNVNHTLELARKDEMLDVLQQRMARAEETVQQAQREALKEREANIALHKQRMLIEKDKKELQLKLVDLETMRMNANGKDVVFLQARVSELEKELVSQDKTRYQESRSLLDTERTIKDLESSLSQQATINRRLEDKANRAEARLRDITSDIELLRDQETQHQLRAKKAEREANDQRERAARAEKDLERIRNQNELSKMSRSNTMNSFNGPSMRLSPSLSSLSMRNNYQNGK